MRFRFKPTAEQRAALRAQLTRLQQPAPVLEILDSVLPADFKPTDVICTVQSAHSDRFVVRAQVRSAGGEGRAYALKVYSDDFGEQVWAPAQTVARDPPRTGNGLFLPGGSVPRERRLW